MSVCVVDMALHSALGDLDETWNGLLAGKSGVRPIAHFVTDKYLTGVGAWIDGPPQSSDTSAVHVLLDKVWDGFGSVPTDAHLLIATTKGGIDMLEPLRRGTAANVPDLDNAALLQTISARFGLAGRGSNINAACASSTIAVAYGAAMIAAGDVDAVLVVCFDLLTEFVFSGFSALQALDPQPSRPFDKDRKGLSLGEGAAALLLMSEERAVREGRTALGSIIGWGVANDANHITAPARDGCGLIQAVNKALHRAAVAPQAISGISAHGTGTVYNDLMELVAFEQVFPHGTPPLNSIKGALGHTLGAAGGIEVVLGLRSLASGQLLPTVGLQNPEERAVGLVSSDVQLLSDGLLLSTNSGFGGINAALILGQGGAA